MLIYFYISVVLVTTIVLSNVDSQNAIQQYVIRRDFFRFSKAPEFTVYDTKEKHIYYRIESKIRILQNIELIAYPSKQEVGRLQAKLKPFIYKAEFSILDPQSNKWISGLIQQDFTFKAGSYSIEWGGNKITIEKKSFGSFTDIFRDSNGEILAEFRLRPASILWTNKYDMQIFSNKFPQQIYLLALAACDRVYSR